MIGFQKKHADEAEAAALARPDRASLRLALVSRPFHRGTLALLSPTGPPWTAPRSLTLSTAPPWSAPRRADDVAAPLASLDQSKKISSTQSLKIL